jgi:peptide/nickel transport system permease protein
VTTYIVRRLLYTIPVLVGITLVTFLFLRFTGDPCTALLGERFSAARCEEIKARYGLDQPVWVQYARYVGRLVRGDLGESIITKRAISNELKLVMPATIELALAAMLLATLVGIPLGLISAVRHNTGADLGAMILAMLGVSMPVFWLGLMLAYVFGFKLGLFPISGRLSTGMEIERITNLYLVDSAITANWVAFRDALHHIILPAIALSTIPAAIIARITRSSMLDVLGQDYIRTARAKGLGERAVVLRHALANAMLPVVTVVGLQMGFLLSGAVLTETIFAWPGMGRWVVQSIPSNDVPVVQAGVLVFALIFVIVNLLVDISYAWLDPRIRYE